MSKKVIAIVVAILVFGALVPNLNAQTSLLHQDFEGSFPPSGWTTVVEAGSNQWYRNDYHGYPPNYTGGGGYCACNNDDYFGYVYIRNNSLQSPAFDASSYPTVWLAFNYTFQNWDGTEHAYVDVFNGSSWVQVEDLSNTGTDLGMRDSTDISAQIAGVANAQVRFRYDEDGGSGWAFWYEVDKVDVWGGTGGGPEIDTVVNENFNGGWPFPGWTTTIGSGNDQWNDLNGLGGFWMNYAASGGGNCAENDDFWATLLLGYPMCVENALISPAFTLGGNIWLEFDRGTYYQSPPSREMRLEVWDGSTWQLIVSYTQSQLWQHDVWSLSAFGIDGVTDAQVRFVYNETESYYSYFYQIDNVLIYGEAGSSAELDLMMVQIIRPRDEEEGGVAFTPECRVLNNLDTATALVGCRFKDFETRETVYEDVLGGVPLVFGYNVVNGFKDFTPESNKKYTALFWLEHDDDVNPTNNAKDKNWTTFAGTDVTPTVMLSPAPQQYNEFDPEATFEEHAGAELTVATLHCKIENGEYYAVVYEDSVTGEPFTAEESKNIKFQTVEGLENGTYTITFWATGELGGNISNPPLVGTFEYSGIAEAPVAERTSLSVSGTTVNFSLEKASDVSIRIYDITGNLITTLVSGRREAGSYTLTWNTTDVASGVYFVKMLTPEFSASGKIVVLY